MPPSSVEGASRQVRGPVAEEMGEFALVCPGLPLRAIAGADDAMVAEWKGVDSTRSPPSLSRLELVDGVPADPLHERGDGFVARPAIRTRCSADMASGRVHRLPLTVALFVAEPSRDPERRVVVELVEDPREKPAPIDTSASSLTTTSGSEAKDSTPVRNATTSRAVLRPSTSDFSRTAALLRTSTQECSRASASAAASVSSVDPSSTITQTAGGSDAARGTSRVAAGSRPRYGRASRPRTSAYASR